MSAISISSEVAPEPTKPPLDRKQFAKRWLKNTAIVGGGYAVGTGLGYLAEKGVKMIAGPHWNKWGNSDTKTKILRGAATIASIGAILATMESEREKNRRLQE